MKKKVFVLLTLLAMIISATGCVKYNATMEIKSDKSMNFTIIYGFSKSLLEMNNQSDDDSQTSGNDSEFEIINDDELKKLKDAGFDVKEYSDDTYKGVEITKKISNIDDYSLESDVEYSLSDILDEKGDNKIFKVEKGTNKNTYTANFKFNANDAESSTESETNLDDTSEEGDTDLDLSQLGDTMASSMDLKYVVKLPNPALSSNATTTSTDGKELTWNLSTTKMDNISFKFELKNSIGGLPINTNLFSLNNPIFYIAIGLLLLIVAVLIIVFSKKEKKNDIQPSTSIPVAQTVESVQPVTPTVTQTAEPVQPVTPTITQTVEPVQPVTPTITQTAEPVQPVTPTVTQTVESVQPVTPTVTQTAEPVQPVTPTVTQTVEPVQPVTPTVTQTAEPVQPTDSNNNPLS